MDNLTGEEAMRLKKTRSDEHTGAGRLAFESRYPFHPFLYRSHQIGMNSIQPHARKN